MKRVSRLLVLLPLGVLATGCGGQPPAQPQGTTQAAATEGASVSPAAASPATDVSLTGGVEVSLSNGLAPAATIAPDLSPQDVVGRFLDALRSGDEAIAAELLTTKARTETAKHDLAVQPPGTPQARYRVGGVEYVTEKRDGAHVSSTWTEPVAGGQTESYEIIWVLRLQPHGWRIAGMATEVLEGQAPLFLNFEDPADMLAKWRQADAEVARSTPDSAVEQARQPAAAGTTQQR